jgi:hypothetical protein
VRQSKLSLVRAQLCELNPSTAIVKLPPQCGEILYFDIDDKLVEYEVAPEQLELSSIAARATCKQTVFDWLDNVGDLGGLAKTFGETLTSNLTELFGVGGVSLVRAVATREHTFFFL